MNKIYTSATQIGDHIFLRGYDEDGERVQEKVPYKPYLFINSKNGSSHYRTLNGTVVDKIQFDSIKEAKEFVKTYEDVSGFTVYGQTNFLHMFLYDEYPGQLTFDRSKLSVGIIDIETSCKGGKYSPNKVVKIRKKSCVNVRFRVPDFLDN